MRIFLKVICLLFLITLPHALGAQGIKIKWQVDVNYAIGGDLKVIPVIYKNTVIFADQVGRVHCLNSETGAKHWTYDSRTTIFNSTTDIHQLQRIDARNGYVTVMVGLHILVLNADNGKLMWKLPCENDRYSDAIIVSNNVITITKPERGIVSAIDLKTSRTSWVKKLNHYLTGNIIRKDNVLLLPTYRDTLLALDARTGNVMWTVPFKVSYSRFGSYDDLFVFNNDFKKIIAINISTGAVVWEKQTEFTSELIVSGRYVLETGAIDLTHRFMRCRNLADGSVLWKSPDSPAIMNVLNITPDNSYFYLRRSELEGSYVEIYDIRNGKLLHSKMFYKTDPHYVVRDNNKLFVGSSTGHGIFTCLEMDVD